MYRQLFGRNFHPLDSCAFFDIIHQDPVISQVKLIAEPWDVGEGDYQVGNFPVGWAEWNGKYRDCVRDFWRGEDQILAELAARFTGSSDLYEGSGRRPHAAEVAARALLGCTGGRDILRAVLIAARRSTRLGRVEAGDPRGSGDLTTTVGNSRRPPGSAHWLDGSPVFA